MVIVSLTTEKGMGNGSMIRLAVFDIDKTLISPGTGLLAEETGDAILRLKQLGIKIAIASGRQLQHIGGELKNLGFDYYILSNGSYVTDGEGNVLHRETIDGDTIEALTQDVLACGYPMDLRFLGGTYPINPDVRLEDVMDLETGMEEFLKEFQSGVLSVSPQTQGERPMSCVGYIPADRGAYFEKKYPQLHFIKIFGGPLCDINKAGVSKASGMEQVCGITGIDMGETIAFGDDMNDVEMIAAAGIGVAMGDAIEEVKRVADHITDTCDGLGVVKALGHFGLLN